MAKVQTVKRGDLFAEQSGERAERPSFVIALWLEPTKSGESPEWRWRVTTVPTGEKAYFRRVSNFLAYISAEAGVPPPL